MDRVGDKHPWGQGASCLVCSYSGRTRVKYSFGSHSISACPLCGLLFLHPQPSPEELERLYTSEEYFFNTRFYAGGNDYIFGYADYFAERFNKQKHFYRIARRCMAVLTESGHPKTGRRYELLEVGCGPGFFLEVAEELGFDVEGIEFNQSILSCHSQEGRFRIRLADYENPGDDRPHGVDCVVMLDVIEHFRKPEVVLEKVLKTLRPGGLLVITTVDSASIPSKILGRRLEDFRRLREHLYFFNRSNMSAFLRRHGFSVLTVGSVGHTFRLDHLLNRIALMCAPHGFSGRSVLKFGRILGAASIRVNPRTKMIVYARRPVDDVVETGERTNRALSTMQSSPAYYDHHIRYIKDYFQNKAVMELGSGNGNASEALLRNGAGPVLGIERNPELIRSCHERFGTRYAMGKIEFRQLDIEQEIPKLVEIIKENGIETIFSFNFLEHIEKDTVLIRSLYEALPAGGHLLSVVPSGSGLFGRMDEYYGHFRRYDIRDMRWRYKPFRLIYLRKCGLIRYVGWMMNKRNPKVRLEKYWDLYISTFFGIDRHLDNVMGRFLPFGGTLVSVHRQDPNRRASS